jgi:ribosomal protein S18 acetylase RimI-like enzyme
MGLGMKPKSGLNFANRFNFDHTQIIENDGLAVGFLMTLEHGSDLTLHTVCILPESQGRGFGTAIIREVLDAASARNRGVIVSVLKANSAARSLYERLGFVSLKNPRTTYICVTGIAVDVPRLHGATAIELACGCTL